MFRVYQTDDGRNCPIEYLPAGAITPKLGLALTQSAGNLAVASGTTKPGYICMTETANAVSAGTRIPVIRVSEDIIYETENTAAFTAINRGDKVTIDSTGLKVTATTTSGVAEVVGFDETAAGSKILVRFA